MSPCQSSGVWFISFICGLALQTPIRLKFRRKRAQDVYTVMNSSSTYGSTPTNGVIYQTSPELGWYSRILGYGWGWWYYQFLDLKSFTLIPLRVGALERSEVATGANDAIVEANPRPVGSGQGLIPSIDHLKIWGLMIGSINQWEYQDPVPYKAIFCGQ